jgi:hypothetical protein
MISSALLSLFNKGTCGARYQDQGKNTVQISSTAFVDDVNTHHTGRHTPDELGHDMVQAYNQWKRVLEVSGGKLSDEKSTICALDWNFSQGGKPKMVDYFDTSDNQQQHHLAGHQAKVADHHKSLGHLVSPKYPESTKVHQVEQIGNCFNASLLQHLTVKKCLILHQSIYTPAFQYVLQNSYMPREKLYHILKSTKAMFLNGLTYNKATKNTNVYGHKSLGGIGYFDPYTEQGLSNIKTFVNTIQDESIAENLLRAAVNTW